MSFGKYEKIIFFSFSIVKKYACVLPELDTIYGDKIMTSFLILTTFIQHLTYNQSFACINTAQARYIGSLLFLANWCKS